MPHCSTDTKEGVSDDATVVTSNTSWSTAMNSSCGSSRELNTTTRHHTEFTNYYDVLQDNDDDDDDTYDSSSIAVDSGASANFGDITTTGTA